MTRKKGWTILKVTMALLCVVCVATILIGHWVEYKCEQECIGMFHRVIELDSEVRTLTNKNILIEKENKQLYYIFQEVQKDSCCNAKIHEIIYKEIKQ